MRHAFVTLAVILGLAFALDIANAEAASLSQSFGDLFGTEPHRVVHRALPATAAPVPLAAPIPLPRPRPAQRPVQASLASKPASAGGATPGPEAENTTPAGPQSVPARPGATAGETAPSKPPRIYQTACPAVMTGQVEAQALPPIADGMCQEQSPLSVTKILVNGRMVPLSAPAIFNCEMATALPGWVADVDSFIAVTQKTRIKSLTVGGSYECRDRNVEGGSEDLSEHGRADALDFTGFALEDGRTLSVAGDYNSPDAALNRLLHYAHDAACTRFTTVLGPDANALHHDHFHLDLGCHGKTCTFRMCE